MWFIIVYNVSVQRMIIYSFMNSVMLVWAGVSWVTLRFWFLSVNLNCRWTSGFLVVLFFLHLL